MPDSARLPGRELEICSWVCCGHIRFKIPNPLIIWKVSIYDVFGCCDFQGDAWLLVMSTTPCVKLTLWSQSAYRERRRCFLFFRSLVWADVFAFFWVSNLLQRHMCLTHCMFIFECLPVKIDKKKRHRSRCGWWDSFGSCPLACQQWGLLICKIGDCESGTVESHLAVSLFFTTIPENDQRIDLHMFLRCN